MTAPRTAPRHLVITGAGGFIGGRLTQRALADPRFSDTAFTLVDLAVPASADPRVRTVAGDLGDPSVLDAAFAEQPDAVVHLAGILGGAAEADYALSRRVNIDTALTVLERLRAQPSAPRVVVASSIAVFGPPLPDLVDDDTRPSPTMTYGAQKLMLETAVEQFSARGWIDGLAIRLPGIVARRDADARQKAAFLNRVFFACEEGAEFTMPVSPDGLTWLISVRACVDAFVHAVLLDPARLGRRRAFTLPAQAVRIADLVAALEERFPQSRGRIRYDPDVELERQFAGFPPLETAIADELGFRHDGDLAQLIDRALAG